MSVKLLTEHNFEFLSLTGGCTGSSESTLVKMPHCWKSHATADLLFVYMSSVSASIGSGVQTLDDLYFFSFFNIVVTYAALKSP